MYQGLGELEKILCLVLIFKSITILNKEKFCSGFEALD